MLIKALISRPVQHLAQPQRPGCGESLMLGHEERRREEKRGEERRGRGGVSDSASCLLAVLFSVFFCFSVHLEGEGCLCSSEGVHSTCLKHWVIAYVLIAYVYTECHVQF